MASSSEKEPFRLAVVSALLLFDAACAVPASGRGSEGVGRETESPAVAAAPEVRLHPGLVASVVMVSLGALVAAIYIIRKFCFPENNTTYRYSVLRQMEERNTRASGDPLSAAEESDEELLE